MELGEKLRQTRLAAGMTQRQLCAGEITRNMLSQIEHGTAQPSLGTLQYLAGRLGKSVSFFLDETAVVSPNLQILEAARASFDRGAASETLALLEDYQAPDPVCDREKDLLLALSLLSMAEEALASRREPYARQLLAQVEPEGLYCADAIRRRKLLLLGRLEKAPVSTQLPSLDEELLLRAREAAEQGQLTRAGHLLEAVEDQTGTQWHLLRGDVFLAEKNWQEAARVLEKVQDQCPREAAPRLEICYRELGDFRKAYLYACMQR